MSDRIDREDILLFVNACVTSTGQRGFYSESHDQIFALDFLHEYIATNYRTLYGLCLGLEINDHNAARIIQTLLLTGRHEVSERQRHREGKLIAVALPRIRPQRVYRLFVQLCTLGLNNRRFRAVVREWLTSRDLAFDAVKYRRPLKAIIRHLHLSVPPEVGDALFRWRDRPHYESKILEDWRAAHYSTTALFRLPATVAQGLAASQGIRRQEFLTRIEPQLTKLERLRLQTSASRERRVNVAIDLSQQPLVRLCSYILSLPPDAREARRGELVAALQDSATRAAGDHGGTWARVSAILDDSYSASGSGEARRRPLAVALASHYLLQALSSDYHPFWLSGRNDPLMIKARGVTSLGTRILDGLKTTPDRLVIVSDGYDNAPYGAAAEVIRVWRDRLDHGTTAMIHLNPVFDVSTFDVARLSPLIPTIGVRDAETIPALADLAFFAAGNIRLDTLTQHLTDLAESRLTMHTPHVIAPDNLNVERSL